MPGTSSNEPRPYIDFLVERCVGDIIAGRAQIADYLAAHPALADELERRIENRLVREIAQRVQNRLSTDGSGDATAGAGDALTPE